MQFVITELITKFTYSMCTESLNMMVLVSSSKDTTMYIRVQSFDTAIELSTNAVNSLLLVRLQACTRPSKLQSVSACLCSCRVHVCASVGAS